MSAEDRLDGFRADDGEGANHPDPTGGAPVDEPVSVAADSEPETAHEAVIENDPDGDEAAPAAKPFDDPVRAAIAARHAESMLAKLTPVAETPAPAADPADEGSDDPDVSRVEATAEAAPEVSRSPAASGAADAASATTVVTVYGRQIEVPTADVTAAGGVAAYQKTLAADTLLARASRTLREIEARASAPPASAPNTAAASPPSGEQAAVDRKEVIRQALEALLENDANTASAKYEEFVDSKINERLGRSTPAASPASPSAKPAGQGYSRDAEEIRAANAMFASEFSAITNDPTAMRDATALILERMRDPALDGIPLETLARDVGVRIARQTGLSGTTSTQASQQLELRRTVKARLPVSSSAAGRAAPAAETRSPTMAERNRAYIRNLRARSGSNSAIAERRASR